MKKVILFLLLFCTVGFAFNKPNWPLEVLTWDVDKAYPGIEYNFRLGVKGGEYPYTFTLKEGPSGMAINSNTGEIKWTPTTSLIDTVVIKITDSKGDTLIHSYPIESTTSKFYFVAKDGSNSNDGSEAHPWLTMTYANTAADSVSYIYVKTGIYTESFAVEHNNCGRFLAYPGDTVNYISNSSGFGSIGINGGDKRIFQGFTFDGNAHRWLFSVGSGGYGKNIIWRKNTMHNIGSNDGENPALIFFWGGNGNPILGLGGHSNIVIQDNIFFDCKDTVRYHCASVTCFDVQNMLYEDNEAYNIDGRGVSDKDMGYYNTIRNNILHDCTEGIGLLTQGGQSQIDVCYNLVYNCDLGVVVGRQAGYLNNTFIYRNNLLNPISIDNYIFSSDTSYNVNVYKNVIGNKTTYSFDMQSLAHQYPDYYELAPTTKFYSDSNVLNSLSIDAVSGHLGDTNISFTEWQDHTFDANGFYNNIIFDNYKIPQTSQYFGVIGREIGQSLYTNNKTAQYIYVSTKIGQAQNCDTMFYQIDLSEYLNNIDTTILNKFDIMVLSKDGLTKYKADITYIPDSICAVYWLAPSHFSVSDTFKIVFDTSLTAIDTLNMYNQLKLTNFYNFNNYSGNNYYDEVNNNDLVVTNVNRLDTLFNSAANFYASTSSINAGNIQTINNNMFTIEGYYLFDSLGQGSLIVTKQSATNYQFTLNINTTNITVNLSNGSSSYATSNISNLITNHTKHHIAVVYNGTNIGNNNRLKIYLDGDSLLLTFVGTIPASGPNISNTTYIGGATGSANRGKIDELGFYVKPTNTEYNKTRYNMLIAPNDFYAVSDFYQLFIPKTPAAITAQPQSITKKSGETATFSVTATGSGLTYQWYGNNTLIEGATSSTYSFTASKILNGSKIWCLLTTDTTISTDTATLTVTDMTISIDPDTLILTIPTDPLFSGYQWYCKDSLISGETSNKITLSIDSTEYINKSIYYCKVWNAVGDTVTSKTWSLKFLLSGVPNTWNSIMLRLRAGFH